MSLILRKQKVHCRVRKSPPLDRIQKLLGCMQSLPSHFFFSKVVRWISRSVPRFVSWPELCLHFLFQKLFLFGFCSFFNKPASSCYFLLSLAVGLRMVWSWTGKDAGGSGRGRWKLVSQHFKCPHTFSARGL